jgi:hypothetical protein
MDLNEHAVFWEFYFGLKVNGWPKDEAAKAARRHLRQMSRRKINQEAARIAAQKRN